MELMAYTLRRDGYDTVNVSYPSREEEIAELAETTFPEAIEACGDQPLHIVTHSMGGILLRHAFAETRPENLGKVVMLGPPNHGSEIVDKLGEVPGFEFFNGPAGLTLGTDENSWPNRLGPAEFPLGIIAGNQSISPYFSSLIDGENDGKVSVNSTRLNNMKDHLVVPFSHGNIVRSQYVTRQTIRFLKLAQFAHRKKQKSPV